MNVYMIRNTTTGKWFDGEGDVDTSHWWESQELGRVYTEETDAKSDLQQIQLAYRDEISAVIVEFTMIPT